MGIHRSTKRSRVISVCSITIAVLLVTAFTARARTEWPRVTASKDGTPISFEIYGAGDTTLIFVHGWSCDARYWRSQLPFFQKKYRVVLLDLAGHGHSGSTRSKYSMKAFGEDVRAVATAAESRNIILAGHSMGGAVIAEAARLMPRRVKGLIGIDTLKNIGYRMSHKELEQMMAPLKKDFQAGTRQFVREMLSSDTPAQLREWILTDMSAAPPSVALSAMTESMSQHITGDAAGIFDELRIPVMTVSGDLWPINYEANRRHMFSFDAIVIKGADHFLMVTRPDEFNRALDRAIQAVLKKQADK